MNAIVCNTMNGAVTEYTGYAFQSITPTHAGDALGLYALGGDTDAGRPIVAQFSLPVVLNDEGRRKLLDVAYIYGVGVTAMEFTVECFNGTRWVYQPKDRADTGNARFQLGRGIRDNYTGFTVRSPAGQGFSVDRVELNMQPSKTRRI